MDIIKNIAIIFISIFFESLPFIILGSLISALIETFISNETITKIIPKNKVLGSLIGVLLGFFLPACDCAVIPVSKRLLKKKMPINVAISFMLASPIINPVVLLSTYYAFYKTNSNIFWIRIILGIIVSLLIGTIMGLVFAKKEVIINEEECACHEHKHAKNKILNIITHTAYDSFDVIKYLLLGALLASIVQVLLPRNILTLFNSNNSLGIITLMLFAYFISLCSTSDSFVGKALLSTFGSSAVIAFLLLGPMIDIKNTMVLLGNYKKGFVITLISFIFVIIFITSLIMVGLL